VVGATPGPGAAFLPAGLPPHQTSRFTPASRFLMAWIPLPRVNSSPAPTSEHSSVSAPRPSSAGRVPGGSPATVSVGEYSSRAVTSFGGWRIVGQGPNAATEGIGQARTQLLLPRSRGKRATRKRGQSTASARAGSRLYCGRLPVYFPRQSIGPLKHFSSPRGATLPSWRAWSTAATME